MSKQTKTDGLPRKKPRPAVLVFGVTDNPQAKIAGKKSEIANIEAVFNNLPHAPRAVVPAKENMNGSGATS